MTEHHAVTWTERPEYPLGGWRTHVVDTAAPKVTICGLRVPEDARPAPYMGICLGCEDVVPWGRPLPATGALRTSRG